MRGTDNKLSAGGGTSWRERQLVRKRGSNDDWTVSGERKSHGWRLVSVENGLPFLGGDGDHERLRGRSRLGDRERGRSRSRSRLGDRDRVRSRPRLGDRECGRPCFGERERVRSGLGDRGPLRRRLPSGERDNRGRRAKFGGIDSLASNLVIVNSLFTTPFDASFCNWRKENENWEAKTRDICQSNGLVPIRSDDRETAVSPEYVGDAQWSNVYRTNFSREIHPRTHHKWICVAHAPHDSVSRLNGYEKTIWCKVRNATCWFVEWKYFLWNTHYGFGRPSRTV